MTSAGDVRMHAKFSTTCIVVNLAILRLLTYCPPPFTPWPQLLWICRKTVCDVQSLGVTSAHMEVTEVVLDSPASMHLHELADSTSHVYKLLRPWCFSEQPWAKITLLSIIYWCLSCQSRDIRANKNPSSVLCSSHWLQHHGGSEWFQLLRRCYNLCRAFGLEHWDGASRIPSRTSCLGATGSRERRESKG